MIASRTLSGSLRQPDFWRTRVLPALVGAVALGIFAWEGKVHWPLGLSLGAGTVLGGLLGVKLTIKKGHRWIKGVVTATILLFAVRLWFTG